jgi:hypothetical protein
MRASGGFLRLLVSESGVTTLRFTFNSVGAVLGLALCFANARCFFFGLQTSALLSFVTPIVPLIFISRLRPMTKGQLAFTYGLVLLIGLLLLPSIAVR